GEHQLVQRGVLCTLARLGTAWRRIEPERTRAWLAQLEPHPLYKGGQFLFDLLEVEDFMLDGPAPPPVSSEELAGIARRAAPLARRGTAWRRVEPERTRAWLAQLEPHPLYKGGQFLFDLLEVEDFMLDGPAPPPVSSEELAGIARRAADLAGIELPVLGVGLVLDALPPLEPGFYLYRDVILGLVFVLVSAADPP